MRSTVKYIHSHLSREVEALMVQLAARAHRTSEERPVEHPFISNRLQYSASAL